MTLFDNESSHSNEATATLTAPEGSTSTNHSEPEASHAVPAPEAAAPATAQSETPVATPSAAPDAALAASPSDVPSKDKPEANAVVPAARHAVELPAHEEAAAEDFATALENYENAAAAEPEESAADRLIKGTVVKITATHVVVDFGAKSEGVVPIAEVQDHTGTVKFKPGDEIPVMVDRSVSAEGAIGLSYQKAQRLHAWDDIEKAYNEKKPIAGIVIDRIKGGVTVDINGARAFLPGSQVDVRPVHNLDALKGQTFDVAIIKLNKKRGNIVVSRKQLLEEEVNAKRNETLSHLEEGSILTGTVKNLTEYGAFVDLGGLDGLLHITDMSWGRLTHPKDLVHVGDHIQVKVLKFDKEKPRVSLGFKQLTPDPWLDAEHRYPVGAHVSGRVISVTDYGAFIELEQGIEGLVHVSEMTWSKRMKHPSKLVNVGDTVECIIISVHPTERRISLGMRQLQSNPWDSLHDKYPVGATVEGRVRNMTDFGVFIEIEEGIDGLVHVSNLSWTKRVKHPSEILKKGDRVKAVILAIEPDKRRLSLGVKQLQPDAWETFFRDHKIGDVMHGKVVRVAAFGAFIDIAEGIEGLCHNSEAVDDKGTAIHFEPGQEYDFKIVKMNPEEKKIGLSIRAVGEEASRAEVEAYKQPAASTSSSGSTIGDLISWKRAGSDQN